LRDNAPAQARLQRKLVMGWSMHHRLDRHMVVRTVQMAVRALCPARQHAVFETSALVERTDCKQPH
jgi:hypothetical protein